MSAVWLIRSLAEWASRATVFRVQAPEQEQLGRNLETVLVVALPIKKTIETEENILTIKKTQ